MRSTNFKSWALASTLLTGAVFALPAFAQDAETEALEQEAITVVGSRIPQANLVSTSPVSQINAEEIASRGVVRVEDIVNQLPQAFAGQGANYSNGATGTANVNLRGLGAERTLVLVNGKRLSYGSPRSIPADLNQIPGAMVERIEVLTGGASAVYGSDAIAGVVNFVLKDDFEGLSLGMNYSFYQHNNNNGDAQDLINEFAQRNPAEFAVPGSSVIDGEAIELTALMGINTDDGKGNATLAITYRNVNPVLQRNRDYSGCAYGTRNGGNDFTCSGSPTHSTANFLDVGGNGLGWFRTNGSSFLPRSFSDDTFNFNPYNYFQRPDERYTINASAHYEFTKNFDVYTDLSFMDNRTLSQIAPSGVFGGGVAGQNGGINCDNAFLTPQQAQFLCGGAGLPTTPVYDANGNYVPGSVVEGVLILRRNLEGGNRQSDIRHTTYRGVIGTRGQFLSTPFDYDLYAVYSNVQLSENYRNELSIAKSSRALNAVRNSAGNIVCAVNADADPSNDDPGCVPYNIFSGAPSAEALAYISNPLLQNGTVTQQIVNGSVFGDLEAYGIKMPSASNPVAFALGFEYRRDDLELLPDANYQSGDGFGQGGPTTPVSGASDVFELFGEVIVPIVEDRPFAKELSFEAAYRYSEYGSGISTDTYKLAGKWTPVEDVSFRVSLQRAVRAPNVIELFSNQSLGLFDLSQGANGLYDPCAGDLDPATATPAPTATAAQCANTGVTAAQYGNIADNPAGQFNQLTGGNPLLDPEEADTFTVGVLFTPSMVPGLTISLDYFDIAVEQLVGTIPPTQALSECVANADPAFCSLITRGSGGTLWANPSGFVTATNINTGSLETSGFDLLGSYSFDLDFLRAGLGSVDLEYTGTYLTDLTTVSFPGAAPFDCVGFYGSSCETPNPEYRHRARAIYNAPNDAFDVALTWRYFGSVELFGGGAAVHSEFDAINWFDLSGNWYVRDGVKIRAGVNNIFDTEPPLSAAVGAGAGNGNTFPQVYDALGRYVFMGVKLDF
jgi:outer membrane receptor protein involved in Fe transport